MFQTLKHSILTWLGILGGALTLLSNLQGILDLAKWADWLVSKWSESVTRIVSGLIDLFGIRVSTAASSMIAMALFVSFIAIGARIENKFKFTGKEHWPVRWQNIFNSRVLLATILYALLSVLFALIDYVPAVTQAYLSFPYAFVALGYILYCGAIIIGLKGWPLWTRVAVALSMIGFSIIFGYASQRSTGQPNVSEATSNALAGICAVLCGFIVVGVAPPLTFTKRVLFMVVGVASVIALSQISRQGFSATP